MSFGTGRSAGKRAKRLSALLRRRQIQVQFRDQLRMQRGAISGVNVGLSSSVAPGSESSGSQGVRGSVQTQAQAASRRLLADNKLSDDIRYNMKKAARKAAGFKLAVTALSMGAGAAHAAGGGLIGGVSATGWQGAMAGATFGSALGTAATGGEIDLAGLASIGSFSKAPSYDFSTPGGFSPAMVSNTHVKGQLPFGASTTTNSSQLIR